MAAAPPTSATPPDVGSPAAYGLCRAFDRAIEQGDDVSTAVAFRRLARAAGGASKVQAFCAAVPGPGAPESGPASAPASAPAPGSATASGSPTTGAQVPETASGTQGLTDGQTLRETESSDPATRTGTPTSGVSTSAGTAPASPGTTSLQAEPTSTTVETTPTGGSPNTTPGRRETTGAPEGTRSLSTRQGRLGLQPYTFSVWVADVTEWATADPDSYPGDSVRAATVTPERSTGYSATGTRGVF